MKRQRSTSSVATLGLAVLVSLSGLACSKSSSLNPVTGKVTFKDQPLGGALITFHPKGSDDIYVVPPTAMSKDDGTFTVVTGNKDGAAAGVYIVTIICSETPAAATGKNALSTGGMDTQDRLKGAYADRAASKIEIEIKKGPNQLATFELK